MNPRTAFRLFEYLFVLLLASFAVAQQFQIAAADYGSGGARANVTVRVRELSRRSAVFQVNNTTLGIDPAPGRAKSLRIRVTDARGQSKIFEYPEGSMVNSRVEWPCAACGPVRIFHSKGLVWCRRSER